MRKKEGAGGPYGLIAAETGEKVINQAGTEEGKEAGVAGEKAGEKGGFEKDRDEKKSGGNSGDPDNGEGDGDGKEKDLLVWEGGGERKKEGVEDIEGIHGHSGLEESNRNHDKHADKYVEVEVKGAEGFLQGLANGPEEPEEDEEEDGVGGGGRDENEGKDAPELALEDEGGLEFENGEEAGGGEVEKPAGGVHGHEATNEVGYRPAAEALFEEVGPTGGAHGAGGWSGLNGDFFPIQVLGMGVFFEILLEHDKNGADDGGIVLKADLGDEVGDNVEQAVGIDDGKGRGRGGGVGDVLVGTLGKVFDNVGEELKLLDEMGEFWGVNLGELSFQHGQAVKKIVHDLRGDAGSPALGKGSDFSHSTRVTESPADGKRTRRWILKKAGAKFI